MVVFSSGGAKNQSYHDECIDAQNASLAIKLPSSAQILRAIAIATKAKFKDRVDVYLDKLLIFDIQVAAEAGKTWDEMENVIYRHRKHFSDKIDAAELKKLSDFLALHQTQTAHIDKFKLLLIWMRMLRIGEIYRVIMGADAPTPAEPITNFFYDVELDALKKINDFFSVNQQLLSAHTFLYPIHVFQDDGQILSNILQIKPIKGTSIGVFDYRQPISNILDNAELKANNYAGLAEDNDRVPNLIKSKPLTYLDKAAAAHGKQKDPFAKRAMAALKLGSKSQKPLPFNDNPVDNLAGVILIPQVDDITIATTLD